KQGTDPDTSFVQWLATIDQEVGQLDSSLNIIHNMGTTLTSLEISVPAAVTSAWLKAPANKSMPDAYMRMSVSIQKKLKELIPFYYFQNLKNYGQHGTAENLLVYAAIPAI